MLPLPLVAKCLETIDVCIWRIFGFMSVKCVNVCCVSGVVKYSVSSNLGVVKYVVVFV